MWPPSSVSIRPVFVAGSPHVAFPSGSQSAWVTGQVSLRPEPHLSFSWSGLRGSRSSGGGPRWALHMLQLVGEAQGHRPHCLGWRPLGKSALSGMTYRLSSKEQGDLCDGSGLGA